MKKLLTLILVISLFVSCNKKEYPVIENTYNIIPVPVSLTKGESGFFIEEGTSIKVSELSDEMVQVVSFFTSTFQKSSGVSLEVTQGAPGEGSIYMGLDESMNREEGYNLDVATDGIKLTAKNHVGLFYGIQTLLQLLPPQIYNGEIQKEVVWYVPSVKVEDYPRYSYRGLHLDVGRHFFDVDFIKKYIDLLAFHKMNKFHWHLTEDQGWRIEIKKYPKLTEISAFRKETVEGHNYAEPRKFDGKRYGGFYTQEEVKEVVKYAQDRFITVIPEIEMPGHSLAVLAAYPELGCGEGPYEVATHWGIFEDVFCPKEETFQFLEDVLTEVMDLFPSKYIHIGGDECPKKQWEKSELCQEIIQREGLADEHELQSYFIQRMEKFINSKGRSIIGWDEILEGGLAPNATVMSWRGVDGGIAAAKQRHDVIMTPYTFLYLDYYQSEDKENEPLAIGGFLPLETVYNYEPRPEELTDEEAKHILGAQANLWTEYIKTPEKAEYMAFPRATALSEIVWSPAENKNYEDFVNRLQTQFKRFDQMNVNYGKHVQRGEVEK